MEIEKQTRLAFHGVDILHVNFNFSAPCDKDMNIDINCVPRVFYPNDNNSIFKIVMEVELKDERYFNLTINAVGNFELNTEITDEIKRTFVNANAPAIMFPYIRSFISTLTANMGNAIGTLTIPTQFFKGDLEEIS
jgi:Preprotein translocase subunit SecB